MEEEDLPNPAADSLLFFPDHLDRDVVTPLPSSLLRTRTSFVMAYSPLSLREALSASRWK